MVRLALEKGLKTIKKRSTLLQMPRSEAKLCQSEIYLFLIYRVFDFDMYKKYHNEREGILGSGITLGAFLPTTEKSKQNDWPEIQIHGVPHLFTSFSDYQKTFNFDIDYWNNHLMQEFKDKDGISFSYCLLRPKSRSVMNCFFILLISKLVKSLVTDFKSCFEIADRKFLINKSYQNVS